VLLARQAFTYHDRSSPYVHDFLDDALGTGAIKGTTIQEQTRQCLHNIQAILEEAGSSMDKLVSVTVILADEDDFAGMNEEWLQWFPSTPPARQGAKLPVRVPGLKVSIAAIAQT
jgi:2-iminobutanoate/2-iminopropanoate deaminase